MTLAPPQNPAGEYVAETSYDQKRKEEFIQELEQAPIILRQLTTKLDEDQLDTKYRNWTIRQIVNHLAESHLNSLVRFKWALTENTPQIKAYDESLWSDLEDNKVGSIEPALILLSGIHAKWTVLLRLMTEEQYDRCFYHPELERNVSLREALASYVWHCHHHSAQIRWIIENHGW